MRNNLQHYADKSDFGNLKKFLQWFCVSVSRDLRLPNRLADYWDEHGRLGRTYSPKPFGQASPTGIQETRSVSALDIVKPNKRLIVLGFVPQPNLQLGILLLY